MVNLNNPIGIKSLEPSKAPFIMNPFRFGSAPIVAEGATFSQSGGYDYYAWTSSGTLAINDIAIEVLIVGGGGLGRRAGGG